MDEQPANTNPYVGPRTFTYADRNRFFGREREARNLLARVVSERLLLFYAQSGAGKSSLLHTRLIPQLQAEEGFLTLPVGRVSGALPAGVNGIRNIHLYNLLASIDQSHQNPARLADVSLTSFLAHLIAEPTGNDQTIRWRYDPSVVPPPLPAGTSSPRYVLIIDQFEEIITSHPEHWRERVNFFQELNQAMLCDPGLWVVLTLREDYLAALDPYAFAMADRLRARFYMERMTVPAALEAIRRPTADAGRELTDEAAEILVDNLRLTRVPGQEEMVPGQYVEPVQLQVVCYQMWENLRNRPPGPITVNDLAEAGDVDESLGAFYEAALADVLRHPELKVSEQQLRTWFSTKLITQAGTRGIVYRDEQSGTSAGLPNQAVDLLARQFLIRTELRAGAAWIELVHDRFVEPIQRANRTRQTPLAFDAEAWLATGKDPKRLYEGQKLDDAAAETEEHPEQHSDAEHQFVAAGQKAQEKRKARWRQWITAGATVLLMIFALLASFAYRNYTQARDAQVELAEQQKREAEAATERAELETDRAQLEREQANEEAKRTAALAAEVAAARAGQLGVQAQAAFATGYYAESLLLAVEALQITLASGPTESSKPIATVERVFQEAILAMGGSPYLYQGGQLYDVAFSADSRWLATAGTDGEIRLWSVRHPFTESHTLRGHTGIIFDLALSPNGELLASAGGDGGVGLWQMGAQPSLLRMIDGHTEGVARVTFSPDGAWLASASSDGTTGLWPVNDIDGEGIILRGQNGQIASAVFSQDGRWLATASDNGTIYLWQPEDLGGEPRVLEMATAVESIAFSSAHGWLVAGGRDGSLALWSLANLESEPIPLIGHNGGISTLEFSADQQWFASGDYGGTVILWTADAEIEEFARFQHDAGVDDVTFSMDNQWLASADRSGTVELLLLQNPRSEPIRLTSHTNIVYSTEFSRDHRWFASVSFDGSARLYSIDLADQAELACTYASRNFTHEEWTRYFGDAAYRRTCAEWPVHDSVVAQARERATALAQRGHLAEAIEQFQQMLALNPEIELEPAAEAERIYHRAQALELAEQARHLAQALVLPAAIELFQQAQALDPSVVGDPEGEAKRIAAQQLMAQGRELAKTFDLEGTIESFSDAVELDATIVISPVAEARRLVADEMVILAYETARLGNLEEATQQLQEAKAIHPALALEPVLAAQIEYGRGLVSRNAYLEAQVALDDALAISPTLDITNTLTAFQWGVICRNGSLLEHSDKVMPACARAIAIEGDYGPHYTNRAVARALVNDLPGAIDDLESYLSLANSSQMAQDPVEMIARQGWIQALRAGVNPIRASVLTIHGRYDEAATIYTELRRLTPPILFTPDEFNNICWYGTMAGRAQEVLYTCDWALMLRPGQANYYDSRGVARAAVGDLDGASQDFQRALNLSTLADNINYAQRTSWVIALRAGHNPVLGHILARNGQIEEALVHYRAMVGTEIEAELLASEWNHLCWYGSLRGYARQVLFACDKAVALAPDDWNYHDSRALARMFSGDFQGAAEDYRFTIEHIDGQNVYPSSLAKRELILTVLGALERLSCLECTADRTANAQ